MAVVLLLVISSNVAWTDASLLAGLGHLNLMAMQGRIVLRSGEGGGVTVKPDAYTVNRSYDHGSRPLFSTQTSHAARRSSAHYRPSAPQLITSREVARDSVLRSVYGRRWGW